MEGGSDTNFDAEGPQWAFAIDLYARPAVSDACLLLQDRLGGDVCLLLFVLFIAHEHQIGLAHSDIANLDDAVADWRREVIEPLRCVRRRLKLAPLPAPRPHTGPVRHHIQRAEIAAEQIELAMLARCFEQRPPIGATLSADAAAVLDRLARFFSLRSGQAAAASSPEVQSALKTLADALAQCC
ncbi:MAG: TIGR02444 family protein [Hyphomicrobiaceae bacterium]|nr:TIGR02444 family protein [Hyphomicrobiaceae bacterium]